MHGLYRWLLRHEENISGRHKKTCRKTEKQRGFTIFADVKRWHIICLAALLAWPAVAQERRLRFVEWNVENLFDTLHDAGYNDREFLPTGSYGWTSGRYFSKLSALSRTLAALGGSTPVDLIALCEVENDSTMVHLTRRSLLARLHYDYLMTHSADVRGIDVALLYQPMAFRPYAVRSLRVPHDSSSERPTRDILFVSGEALTGDTLHIFVCHLPSRRGGQRVSEPYRLRAARLIRQNVDSLLAREPHAKIIIAGDFNDEPTNASIATTLRALPPPQHLDTTAANDLFVLTSRIETPEGIRGTYKFRGQWNRLDNIIVSTALLTDSLGLHTNEQHCHISTLPHLLEPDGPRGNVKPRRTYLGKFYHGGTSDHLPVTLDLFF